MMDFQLNFIESLKPHCLDKNIKHSILKSININKPISQNNKETNQYISNLNLLEILYFMDKYFETQEKQESKEKEVENFKYLGEFITVDKKHLKAFFRRLKEYNCDLDILMIDISGDK